MEQEKIIKMKEMHEKGEYATDIAKALGVNRHTVYYYLDEEFRKKKLKDSVNWFRKLPQERKKAIYKKRLPYMTKYQHKRYNSDPIFRNKQLQRMNKKNKLKEVKNE